MKKQLRNLVLSLCVVVLLVAGVLVWSNVIAPKINTSSSSSTTTSSTASIVVYKKNSTKITKLHVKNSKGEYTINQKNSKFTLDGITTSILSQDSLSGTISTVADIEATKLIEKNATNLGSYGLKTPKEVLDITTSDGKTVTINVGKDTPVADGTYINVKGSSTVYKANSSMGSSFTEGKTYYIDTTLYTVDSSSLAKLTRLEFGGTSRAKPIVLQEDTAATKAAATSSGSTPVYLMKSPYAYPLNDTNVSTLTSAVESISADSVISLDVSDKNLQKYGLKSPTYTFSATYNKKKTTFDFGSSFVEDGTTYLPVVIEGKPVIYKVDSSNLTFYNYQLTDLTSTELFTPNISTVKSISVTSSNGSYTLNIGGTSSNIKGTVNGKIVKDANVRGFYAYVISVLTEGEATKPAKGSTYATVVFTYNDAKKTPTTIKYISMDSRRCFISMNGQGDFYTMRTSVDTMLTEMQNLVAGKTVSYS